MNVNKILKHKNFRTQKFDNSTNKNRPSFQGYVNGKFFKDEIIIEAKKALKNPNWKKDYINSKKALIESFKTWHKREGSNDIFSRVLMGIFTLGLTEVTWGLAQAARDASDNADIDQKIEEIEECLINLKESNSKSFF